MADLFNVIFWCGCLLLLGPVYWSAKELAGAWCRGEIKTRLAGGASITRQADPSRFLRTILVKAGILVVLFLTLVAYAFFPLAMFLIGRFSG